MNAQNGRRQNLRPKLRNDCNRKRKAKKRSKGHKRAKRPSRSR